MLALRLNFIILCVAGIAVAKTPAVDYSELSALQFQPETLLDFGKIPTGTTRAKSLALKNSGTKPVTIKEIRVGGAFALTGTRPSDCERVLSPGAKCEISIVFDAKTAGSFAGYAEVVLSTHTARYRLGGTGQRPAALVVETNFDFDSAAKGKATERSLTLRNGGDLEATGIGADFSARAGFEFKGGSYPGNGGTCGDKLPVGGVCRVVVTFSPPGVGPFAAALVFNYRNGNVKEAASVALGGFGLMPATLSILAPEDGAFGKKIVGFNGEVSLTVTNYGDLAAEGLKGERLPKDSSFQWKAGTCQNDLAARASCAMTVTFAPSAAGKVTQRLGVSFFDGTERGVVVQEVTGEGLNPARLVMKEEAPYVFEPLLVTKKKERIFEVTNSGNVPAEKIKYPPPFKKAPFVLVPSRPEGKDWCGETLAPETTCKFIVELTPEAPGPIQMRLPIKYFDGLGEKELSPEMRGRALNPASLTLIAGLSFDYGMTIAESVKQTTFELVNHGEVDATAINPSALTLPFSFSGRVPFPGEGGTCGATLAPGAKCRMSVTYAPEKDGTYETKLKLPYSDGLVAREVTLPLLGKSIRRAKLELVGGNEIDYGLLFVTGEATKRIVIKNSGQLPALTLRGFAFDAKLVDSFHFTGNSYPGKGGSCGETVEPGRECALEIQFAPEKDGKHTAELKFAYEDGFASTTSTMKLSGKAHPPAILTFAEKPKKDFGSAILGEKKSLTLEVKNTGDNVAKDMRGKLDKDGVTFAGGSYPGEGGTCERELAIGKTCKLVVNYAPKGAGGASAPITLGYENGVKRVDAEETLVASAMTPANLELASDGGLHKFGTSVVGVPPEKVFQLKNSGQAPLRFLKEKVTIPAPFAFKGGSFPGDGGDCKKEMAAGVECKIALAFDPQAEKEFDGELVLGYHDGVRDDRAVKLKLRGEGKMPAQVRLEEEKMPPFEATLLGKTRTQIAHLKNLGGTEAEVQIQALESGVFTRGDEKRAPASDDNCGEKLGAGKDCKLVLTFGPKETGGAKERLKIRYQNGVTLKEVGYTLRGEGKQPATVEVSTEVIDFGALITGQSAVKKLKIANRGDVDATRLDWKWGSRPGGLTMNEGCPKILPAGEKCAVELTYSPTRPDTVESELTLRYETGIEEKNATVKLRGVAAEPPPSPTPTPTPSPTPEPSPSPTPIPTSSPSPSASPSPR